VFRILVVDDNPAEMDLLDASLKVLSRPFHLDWVQDGAAALDYLARHKLLGTYPDLVLMDVNMPRLNGLHTLIALKSDPDLRVIPVIMFSTSTSPAEIRKMYEAHATSFVRKPDSVAGCERLVRAIEAFWIDFAVRPSPEPVLPRTAPKGISVATGLEEVKSQPTSIDGSKTDCREHRRLMEQFAASVKELLDFHQQQFDAAVHGDPECNRFDLLIHMANEKKQMAKYDYLRHVESHGCSNPDAVINSSGT
jgi:CheY-like chemotaxis protein